MENDYFVPKISHLFTYGTLGSAFTTNEAKMLRNAAPNPQPATVCGAKLYLIVDGELRYPALVMSKHNTDIVVGELYTLPTNPKKQAELLAELDAYEEYQPNNPIASSYLRCIWPVTNDQNKSILAWVYIYNLPVGEEQILPNGRYIANIEQQG
jgi:gamma-glutamylcyclotransferase (GGCT)/AIG2-like uncharacterized protein YtfP